MNPLLFASHLHRSDRQAPGKALRPTVPRSVHREWHLPGDRAELVSLIEKYFGITQ